MLNKKQYIDFFGIPGQWKTRPTLGLEKTLYLGPLLLKSTFTRVVVKGPTYGSTVLFILLRNPVLPLTLAIVSDSGSADLLPLRKYYRFRFITTRWLENQIGA